MVLLDAGTPGTSRQSFSEDGDGETQISPFVGYQPSAVTIELTSLRNYCWEGVKFIQLVYCIIVYLSLLNFG